MTALRDDEETVDRTAHTPRPNLQELRKLRYKIKTVKKLLLLRIEVSYQYTIQHTNLKKKLYRKILSFF
jgi:hypothetical protein